MINTEKAMILRKRVVEEMKRKKDIYAPVLNGYIYTPISYIYIA